MRHTARLITAMVALSATGVVCGQDKAVRATERVAPQQRAALPRAVAVMNTKPTSVLIIPERAILDGLGLTSEQESALVWRLKQAPFRIDQPSLTAQQATSMRLPTGELFMPIQAIPMKVVMQKTLPTAPPIDESLCSIFDYTDEHLGAFRRVLMAQLTAIGENAQAFVASVPQGCRRDELTYYLQASVIAAR